MQWNATVKVSSTFTIQVHAQDEDEAREEAYKTLEDRDMDGIAVSDLEVTREVLRVEENF